MKTNTLWTKKLLSLIVAVTIMAMILVPYGVMATGNSTIFADFGEKEIVVGETVEFTVSTIANDDAGVMVKGKFEIEAEDADISKLEYYETFTGMEGWYEFPNKTFGEFGPATTGFPMMDATSTFRVTFAEPGEYGAKVSAVKVEDGSELCSQEFVVTVLDWADYTKLEAAVSIAEKYDEAKYTPESYNALNEAIENANNVDKSLTESNQAEIDALEEAIYDAIDALVKVTTVNFYAAAVAEDPAENYAIANKIVLVFGESIEEDADIASKLSIAEVIENARWINDTVYELGLTEDHGLLNGTVIEYVTDYSIKTVRGEALTDAQAIVEGNLEGAAEYVTATAMTATIVKNSAHPGVSPDDKVVLVFNAPVYGTPDEIEVNGMTAASIDDTYTVYEIVLEGTEEINDYTTLSYEGIEAGLNGTFNESKAPVVVGALAVENSGDALLEGDEIVVYFDRPTNGESIDANVVFGDAEAEWNDANTILTFVLGAGASYENGMKINLGNIGIMDEFETVDYEGVDFECEGALIVGEAPVVERILIVDNNGTAKTEGDEIIISFNIPTNGPELTSEIAKSIVVKEGQGLGSDFKAIWNDAKTEIVITVGKTANLDDEVLFDLSAWGITDCDGLYYYVGEIIEPVGSFGTSVAPKITRAIAFTQGTRHIIRVFFNTEIVIKSTMDVSINNNFNIGTDASEKWTNNGITYFDLILGEDHSEFVTGVNTITFDGVIADKESGKSVESVSAVISGGFERDIEPEIISLTAYSQDGSGVAKAGDKVILVLNSAVTSIKSEYDFVSDDKVTWTYTLAEDGEIAIGDELGFEIESQGKSYENSASVAGSFGYKAEVKLLSVTAYSQDGSGVAKAGDEIVVVFNSPVAGLTSELGKAVTTDNMTWIITLEEDNAVEIGAKLTFGVEDLMTNEALSFEKNLTGSFGYETEIELLSATVYSEQGNGVANAGDKIVLVFNAPVTGVASELGTVSTENGVVWTITLEKTNVEIGNTMAFDVSSVASGKVYSTEAKLEGSFGYLVEPEIISVTAYSKDGSGVAKAGDKIVVVFNTSVKVKMVNNNHVAATEGNTYTYTLTQTDILEEKCEIGKNFELTVESVVTGVEYTLDKEISGSYGEFVEPEIISVTAYSKDGSGVAKAGDKVVVVFNTLVQVTAIADIPVKANAGYTYEYTLKENGEYEIGDKFQFTAISVASGESYELEKEIGGSYGNFVEPTIQSVTAISKTGCGVAMAGDSIVVVFDSAVRVGAADANEVYVYTYILTDEDVANERYAIGSKYSIVVWSAPTGLKYTLEKEIGGSYGYIEIPKVMSATLMETVNKEIIRVVFDKATNMSEISNENQKKFRDKNEHLGAEATAEWSDAYTLTITLGADATTTTTNVLNLSGLGIKSAASGEIVTGLEEIEIKGSLIPVVTDVIASEGTITINFSARTNGKADITKLTSLLGVGAKAAWGNYNKTLTITLGENHTMTNNGYIVLNDMGIYDGFSEKYHVTGQYQVTRGDLEGGVLVVTKIVAQSSDKSCATAQQGDKIIVKFNSATNLKGNELGVEINSTAVDEIIAVEGGNEKLGAGYNGIWTAYDTFEIILGGEKGVTDPTIAVGDVITVKSVAFANGENTMAEQSTELTGSFNGREFVVTDGKIERTADKDGDYRISVKVENTLLDTDVVPTIVCVGYKGNEPVSVMRVCVDVETSVQPVFEFARGYEITSAKIYVFNDVFADMAGAPEVLAETYTIEYSK